jgi:hypothetical protein
MRAHTHTLVQCIKFPNWADDEMNTRWEATKKTMAAKLTRLTHEIAIQLYLVAESCAIHSSRSRRPDQEILDTTSYYD